MYVKRAVSTIVAEYLTARQLSSALMQEQASFGLLYTAPPQFRKFAMRLLFAGHRFVNASQQKHAFRCYAFADGIYAGRDWVHIDSRACPHKHTHRWRHKCTLTRTLRCVR